MASQQEPLISSNTTAKWEKYIKAYETCIRKEIFDQANFEPDKLNIEHQKIVSAVTQDLGRDTNDVQYLLEERWMNLVAQEEERTWKSGGESLEAYLCIYLTADWIQVVAYTKNQGSKNINFGNTKPGFSARMSLDNGKLSWSNNIGIWTEDYHSQLLKIEPFRNHIYSATQGDKISKELITDLFRRVKEFVGEKIEENISQIILLTLCSFQERSILRDCCRTAGFKRILIVSDCSFAASRIFSKYPLANDTGDTPTVLVANITAPMLRLEVFGCDMNDSKINGVKLLSHNFGSSNHEAVRNIYKRAVSQLSAKRENCLQYYAIISTSDPGGIAEKVVDDIFQDEIKLTKTETFHGDKLKDFLHFFDGHTEQENSFDVMASAVTGILWGWVALPKVKKPLPSIVAGNGSAITEGKPKPPMLVKPSSQDTTAEHAGKKETKERPESDSDESKLPGKFQTTDGKPKPPMLVKPDSQTLWIKPADKNETIECLQSEAEKAKFPPKIQKIEGKSKAPMPVEPELQNTWVPPADEKKCKKGPQNEADTEKFPVKIQRTDDKPKPPILAKPDRPKTWVQRSDKMDIKERPKSEADMAKFTVKAQATDGKSKPLLMPMKPDTPTWLQRVNKKHTGECPQGNTDIEKFPVKIRTTNGNTCVIMAYTNWTVEHLKKQFLDRRGLNNGKPLELEYKEDVLSDDNILSACNIEPDSVLQAIFDSTTANEVPDLVALKISAKSPTEVKLVGNCVALKNGTDAVQVEGIKPGCTLLAKTDPENLTVGEVKMTCKIKGFGKAVYVGIKFKKSLSLGSHDIKIEHDNGAEGRCEKCKGRKSLFIPRDLIGSLNTSLFLLQ